MAELLDRLETLSPAETEQVLNFIRNLPSQRNDAIAIAAEKLHIEREINALFEAKS